MPTVFKNVPIPSTSDGTTISEPLRALAAVGDMTFIPIGDNAKTRRAAIHSAACRLGMVVSVSAKPVTTLPAPAEPSFAVWRRE